MDPDTEHFIENDGKGDRYHVTFLDDNVSRRWVKRNRIYAFTKKNINVSYSSYT